MKPTCSSFSNVKEQSLLITSGIETSVSPVSKANVFVAPFAITCTRKVEYHTAKVLIFCKSCKISKSNVVVFQFFFLHLQEVHEDINAVKKKMDLLMYPSVKLLLPCVGYCCW